jgi:hypothetical protein
MTCVVECQSLLCGPREPLLKLSVLSLWDYRVHGGTQISAWAHEVQGRIHAATTLIRPAFRERGFRRITISTSWSSAVNRFIKRSTEKPASL